MIWGKSPQWNERERERITNHKQVSHTKIEGVYTWSHASGYLSFLHTKYKLHTKTDGGGNFDIYSDY